MYKDANFVTFQGNVSISKKSQNQHVTVYHTRNGKAFAFVRLTNHTGRFQTTVEFQAWGQHAKTLSLFSSGDKIKVRARLAHGKAFTDARGYKHYPTVPSISTASLVFKAGDKTNQRRPRTNRANHSMNRQNQATPSEAGNTSNPADSMNPEEEKALMEQEDEEAEAEADNQQ